MAFPGNPVRDVAMCKVAVCMTTFRRPEGATSALAGIAAQVFVRNRDIEPVVIVVDNDAAAPMRELVERLRPSYPFPLVYACETRQGVASARNRCLDLIPADADYMAFIDDDESPVPQWLDELVATARQKHAEIVQGPVLSRFDEGAPGWVRAGRFLDLGPFPEGETLGWGYSGNVLLSAPMLRRLNLRFDGRFDRSGGEDQHFFIKALRAGCVIHTAPKAIAYERVPSSRATLRYLARRQFRVGATLALVARIERDGPRAVAVRAAKGVARMGLGAAKTALALPRGRHKVAMGLLDVAFGAGMLAGLLGFSSREYDTIHGATASSPDPALAPPPGP